MEAMGEVEVARVLIVDDDPEVRTSLARCVRVWGLEPDVAASGEEALALASAWQYEFVITDLHMPGIGGAQLLDRLAHSSPETSCIVLTGDVLTASSIEAFPNVLRVFRKPAPIDALHAILVQPDGGTGTFSRRPPASIAPTQRVPIRPLIVEDNGTDALVLQLALSQTQSCATPVIVSTLGDALARLREEPFDVVLTDLRLSDSDGLSTVKTLLARAANVPVVVVSGNDNEELAEQAVQAGAQDYLIKGEFSRAAIGRIVRYAVERKKTEARLMNLAMRDQLTGLVNRMFFRERVAGALARARRTGQTFAVFYLDLDGFKSINDSLGHDAGDSLIQQAARRLTNALREEDTVARLGGDEFAVLLDNPASPSEVMRVAERCRLVLARTFELGEGRANIAASIGIAFYPEAGHTVDTLLSAADAAMYRAKKSGRNRVCVFSVDLHRDILARYHVEQALKEALARDEFRFVLQPQVDAISGEIVGAEALLRWFPEENKPISPAVFIPVLEESGQIIEVGNWILREACAWMAEVRRAGLQVPRVSVNVSARQFEKPSFCDEVQAALADFRIEPGELELELTEATLVRHADVAAATMHKLRQMGVRLALDDFGTGFSSLNYLNRFPVDTLKVDRSFVTRLPDDDRTKVLASAIFELGRGLGLETVAEGVETPEQRAVVVELGGQLIQGYLTGRPCPPDELAQQLPESKAPRRFESEDQHSEERIPVAPSLPSWVPRVAKTA